MPLIVSLTTIPPRFVKIIDTINSLKNQTIKPDFIELYIPKKYKRFQYSNKDIPKLPSWVNIVEIEGDFGPATKVLPALKRYPSPDNKIIFCDDDRVYDKKWVERFLQCSEKYPEFAIAEVGWLLEEVLGEKFTNHKQEYAQINSVPKNIYFRLKKLLGLGIIKPHIKPFLKSGFVDILGGCGGVLVKPNFFDSNVHEIPDECFTVDDIWLSGQLEKNNRKIWVNAEGYDPHRSKADKLSSLIEHELNIGKSRLAANTIAVNYLREKYGIWR